MKTVFLALVFGLLIFNPIKIIGTYQIESESAFDTLKLKKNGTYTYKSRGDSCWTWSDFSGTWKMVNDELTLYHRYSYQEETIIYSEQFDQNPKDFIIFEVTDITGKSISEFEVKYYLTDSQIQIKKTDINGIIKFKKYDFISELNTNVNIEIKYPVHGKESTQNYYGLNRNSDRIILKINSEPNTIHKTEKYKFLYKNEILKSIDFRYAHEMSTFKKL